MPGYRQHHRFEGLGEFRDAIDQLARASSHPVLVDVGDEYVGDGDGVWNEPIDLERVDHQAIWNTRDNELAYIGTDAYEVTQHRELLDVIDSAVGQTVGEIDIGRIRDYGERIDGMLTLDGHSIDVGELVGDGYVPPEGNMLDDRTASVDEAKRADGTVRDILGVGIRFANSFDASERIRLETMGYRYICQNWLVWGEETIGEFTQLHIDELQQDDIEGLIFDVVDRREEVESIIVDAADEDGVYPISWADSALDDVGFGPRQRTRILELLTDFDSVDDEFTRWEIYNAATEWLDHTVMGEGDDGVNANVYDRHQDKAVKLLMEDIDSPSDDAIEAGRERVEALNDAA